MIMLAVALLAQAQPMEKVDWKLDKGKELALTMTYSEKHETTKGDKTETQSEVRDVKAKATAPFAIGGFGMLDLNLTDVTWTMSDGTYEAKVTKAPRGIKPEATGSEKGKEVLKHMEEQAAAVHKMRTVTAEMPQFGTVQNEALVSGREVKCVFRNVFVMSPWTTDLRENVAWDVKLTDIPCAEEAGLPEIKMKINVKDGEKWGAVGEVRKKWKSEDGATTGSIFVRRKMEWNRKGWLQLAEEEVKFTRDTAEQKYSLSISSKLRLK